MCCLKVREAVDWAKGLLLTGDGDLECNKFSWTSSNVQPGEVAIIGKTNNLMDTIEDAYQKGAIGCIIEEKINLKKIKEKYPDKFLIFVKNARQAYMKLSICSRNEDFELAHKMVHEKLMQWKIPVVAITGTCGKSFTTSICGSIVNQKYKALYTKHNQNGMSGTARTVLQRKDEELIVLELGLGTKKSLNKLSCTVEPDIAAILNIGTGHIVDFGSKEALIQGKLEIFDGLKENGIAVINNDDENLRKWKENHTKKCSVITFGIEHTSDYMATDIVNTESLVQFRLIEHGKDTGLVIQLPTVGKHYVLDCLCAIAISRALQVPLEDIQPGIDKASLEPNRMHIVTKKGITIIDDTYNACLESVTVALEYLAIRKEKRKIAILGDMINLGDFSYECHQKVGEAIVKNHIDLVILVGKEVGPIAEVTTANGIPTYSFNTNEEAIAKAKKIMKKGDCVLIKASNDLQFIEIVNRLTKFLKES